MCEIKQDHSAPFQLFKLILMILKLWCQLLSLRLSRCRLSSGFLTYLRLSSTPRISPSLGDGTNIWRLVKIMKILAPQQFLSIKVKYPPLYTVDKFPLSVMFP